MDDEIPGAAAAMAEAFVAALQNMEGLNGAYSPQPVQAACPYAVVDAGIESDWSHKSGDGREVRIAVTIHDEGEHPARPTRLAQTAETAVRAIPNDLPGWQLVNLVFLRSRTVRGAGPRWTAAIDYRARLLRK